MNSADAPSNLRHYKPRCESFDLLFSSLECPVHVSQKSHFTHLHTIRTYSCLIRKAMLIIFQSFNENHIYLSPSDQTWNIHYKIWNGNETTFNLQCNIYIYSQCLHNIIINLRWFQETFICWISCFSSHSKDPSYGYFGRWNYKAYLRSPLTL